MCFLEGIRLVRAFGESRDLVLSPSRSDLVVQSCYFFPCSKSRDLGPEHGFRGCSFENERKKLNFHEKMKVATLFFHQVGQIWFGELSICQICAESQDLEFEHGFRACS